jgi:hypothetical protein
MLARRVCRRDPLPRRLETIRGRGPELASGEESTPGRRGANLWQESVRPKGGVLLARHAERRQKGKRKRSSLFNSFLLSWTCGSRTEQEDVDDTAAWLDERREPGTF